MRTTRHLCLWLALVLVAGPAWAQRGGRDAGRQMRGTDTLSVGDMAPDFKLKTMDGKQQVQLSSFRGKRPVVLVFGSYT
jgi:hypothetical protein